jgi:hypothetical protein
VTRPSRCDKMRILCEVCGKVGYLQHIGKNYYRVRHYERLDPKSKKPVFSYHQQSLEYINSKIDQTGQCLIDPKRLKLDSVVESEEGRSSSLVGRWLYEPKVAGPSPARPTNKNYCLKKAWQSYV